MLPMAAQAGTTDIVDTPQDGERFVFGQDRVALAIEELQQAAGDTPRIRYDRELHLTPEGIEDALRAGQVFDRPSRTLLLEFANSLVPGPAEKYSPG